MKVTWIAPCVAIAACAHARSPQAYEADTAKVIATQSGTIKACYDKVLATTPTAAGRVTVNFAVAEKTGQITNPQLDSAQTTAPDAVSQCVLAALPALVIAPADPKRGLATWAWDFSASKVP